MDKYFYCGILFSKENEDHYNAYAIDSINDTKQSILEMKSVRNIKYNKETNISITVYVPIDMQNALICEYQGKNNLIFGIYDENRKKFIDPLSSYIEKLPKSIKDRTANLIDRYINAYARKEIKECFSMLDKTIEKKWTERKTMIEKCEHYQHISEMDFITDHKTPIQSEIQFANAMPENILDINRIVPGKRIRKVPISETKTDDRQYT